MGAAGVLRRWAHEPRVLALASAVAGLTAALGYSFGMVPGRQVVHLTTWSIVNGYSACADIEGDVLVAHCSLVGAPEGAFVFEGIVPYSLSRWAAAVLPVTPDEAFQWLGLALVAGCLVAMVLLGRLLLDSSPAGLVAGVLYTTSASVFGDPGLPQTLYGALLLPPVVLMTLLARRQRATARSLVVAALAGGAVGLVLLNVSGYALLFGLATSGSITLVAAVVEGRSAWRRGAGTWVALTGVVVAGGSALVQRWLLWPSQVAEGGFPADLYRAAGTDLVGLLTPPPDSLLWGAVGVTSVPPLAESAVRNHAAAFIGWLAPIAVVVGLVALARWRQPSGASRPLVVGVAVTTLLCLAAALGPSLRVGDPWPTGGAPTVADERLMPPDAAALELPWAFLFQLPPLDIARVVDRWQIPLRLGLALLVAGGLVVAWRRARRVDAPWPTLLVLGFAALVLAEGFRPGLLTSGGEFWRRDAWVTDVVADVVVPLDDTLPDGASALYLPAGNDYLSPALGPLIGVSTVNVVNDKNLALANEARSDAVRTVIGGYRQADAAWAALAREVVRTGEVDALVLDDFSLRRAAYGWPPRRRGSVAELAATRRRATGLLSPHCAVTWLEWSTVVTDCR